MLNYCMLDGPYFHDWDDLDSEADYVREIFHDLEIPLTVEAEPAGGNEEPYLTVTANDGDTVVSKLGHNFGCKGYALEETAKWLREKADALERTFKRRRGLA